MFASLERRPTTSKGVSACTTRFQLLQSEVWGAAFSLGCCSTTVRRPGDTFLAHNNCRELAAAQLRGMPPACRGHLPCSVKDGGLNPPPCCRRHAPAAGPAGRGVAHPLALLLLVVWLAAPALSQSDAQLLINFKSTFSNGESVLSNWIDATDPCSGSWTGVMCDGGRPSHM